MKGTLASLAAAAVVALSAGCASDAYMYEDHVDGNPALESLTADVVAVKFKDGVTTRGKVVAALGAPGISVNSSDGTTMVTYSFTRTNLGRNLTTGTMLWVWYDKQGVVTKTDLSKINS